MLKNEVEVFLAQAPYTKDTKKNYRRNLGYWFDWWGDRALSDVLPSHYLEFLKTKNWGDSQQHTCLYALKGIIRWKCGEKDDLNRTREILLLKIRREEPDQQRTLELWEIEKLSTCLDLNRPSDQRNYVMLRLALDSRLRSSEVCNIKIREIDFENRTFVTRRKGGKREAGRFSEDTALWIKAWMIEREGYAKPGVDELFVNIQGASRGLPMKPTHWRITCRRWAKRAGIEHFSPHALCRSFAVMASQLGASTHLIAMAGGWRDESMVRRYTKSLRVRDFEPYLPSHLLVKGEGPVPADPSGG